MKKTKIFFSVLVVALSLLCLIGTFNRETLAAANLSEYAEALDEKESRYVNGPMTVNVQHIQTVNNGVLDKINGSYFFNKHTVNWIDFDVNSDYRIVTYSGLNADKWRQLTVRQACANFEKAHPGWLVVAGINGDFFDNSSGGTYEPTNNFMTMSDMFRPDVTTATDRATIGWKSDGSVIYGKPSVSSGMFLRILDGEAVKSSTSISKVNAAPSSTGITLLTKDMADSVDLTGFNVYVCSYEICRISSGKKVFVKGSVESVTTSLGTNSKPEIGKFYLCDKDNSLSSLIKVGNRLKCEYVYEDEWADVQNSVGFIRQTLKDSVPQEQASTDLFCNTTHPRTLIGIRPDGSTIFMVIDGRGTVAEMKIGASIWECGELLRINGCVTGFNLDGGGSSTLVVRGKNGDFEVVNTPSDGSERSDGNHVLVIMRDPGFSINTTATYSSVNVKLNITNQEYFSSISNIKLVLNGVEKDYNPDGVTFDGLNDETDYLLTVKYDGADNYDGTKLVHKQINYETSTTEYQYGPSGLSIKEIGKDYIVVHRDMSVADAAKMSNINTHIGDGTYNMKTDLEDFKIEGLISETEYPLYYTYDIKADNGKVFNVTTTPTKFTTKAYNPPVIVEFNQSNLKDTSVSINYKYTDTDRKVTSAYLYVNGQIYGDKITIKTGSIDLKDLDRTNNEYRIKLVINYGENEVLESDEIVLEKIASEPVQPSEPEKPTKKCGKKSAELIVSLISMSTLLALVLKGRKH